jgi:hypothetical protein
MKNLFFLFALLLASCGGQGHVVSGCKPVPIADAGPAQAIVIGLNLPKAVQLGTPAIAGMSYAWTPSEGLSNPAVAQPIASPARSMTYVLTATNECGYARSQVAVSVYAEDK